MHEDGFMNHSHTWQMKGTFPCLAEPPLGATEHRHGHRPSATLLCSSTGTPLTSRTKSRHRCTEHMPVTYARWRHCTEWQHCEGKHILQGNKKTPMRRGGTGSDCLDRADTIGALPVGSISPVNTLSPYLRCERHQSYHVVVRNMYIYTHSGMKQRIHTNVRINHHVMK
jgi:hypothetical protein